MPIKKIKIAIKSNPLLYGLLLPRVARFRQLRKHRKRPDPKEELNRFQRICRKLPDFTADPFFAKVGANDGIAHDPCSHILIKDPRWRGLLVEPVPHCFEKLKANFSDTQRFIVEPVAIGAEQKKIPFYYVSESARSHRSDLPDWCDMLGSFNRNHILKHLDGQLEPFIIEHSVEVHPLSAVLARNNIQKLDLLHIDTEGHDLEVLKTINLHTVCPLLIFAEHQHLSPKDNRALHRLLRRHGYSVRNTGADYLAIHKKTAQALQIEI
jgi:FkbM family methyltransferase